MTAFRAIVVLTIRSAMRSNVFRTLCVLLAITMIAVPLTVVDDGTAKGFIQLILQYSLSCVMTILCISSVWLTCSEVCSDVETGQIHMIVVKSVSRITVLLGKLTGVLLMHCVLFFASAIIIYGIVMGLYSSKTFTKDEAAEERGRERVKNEVFTARRVYAPISDETDITLLIEEDIKKRQEQAKREGLEVPREFVGLTDAAIRDISRKAILASRTLIKAYTDKVWNYEGLPNNLEEPFTVRYKLYKGADAYGKNQATTYGMWGVRIFFPTGKKDLDGNEEYSSRIEPLSAPEEIVTVSINEFSVPYNPMSVMSGISPIRDGKTSLAYMNYDLEGSEVNLQQTDGPFILIRKASFFENYLRTVFLGFLGIVALTMIAGAFGACFTLPTAIFMTVCYMLASFFASYQFYAADLLSGSALAFVESVGFVAANVIGFLMIRIQDFFAAAQLSNGELIEFSLMLKHLAVDILLRGMIFLGFGAWIYRRKELALAMKK